MTLITKLELREHGLRILSPTGRWWVFNGFLMLEVGDEEAWEARALVPVPEEVTRITRHADERPVQSRYLCRFAIGLGGKPSEIVASLEEIRTGEAWDLCGQHIPSEPRVGNMLAAAIVQMTELDEPANALPHFVDGRLVIPAQPIGPEGYGVAALEPGDGEAWEELAWLAVVNPMFALVLGAAVAGMYVKPLGLTQCPWLHLIGDSSVGKTTALSAAAAIYGDPELVMFSFYATREGFTQVLSELSCLPAFVDELGATTLNSQALGQLGYQIAQGKAKRLGRRDGGSRKGGGAYRSVMLSTGNQGLARVTKSPGLPARIIELYDKPFATAREAERVSELVHRHYGWPLELLVDGMDVDRFDSWRKAQRIALGELSGVLGRVASHLALFITGAGELGEVLGVPELGAAAFSAAQTILGDTAGLMDDEGADEGERLLAAVTHALVSRAYAYPRLAVFDVMHRGDAEGIRTDEVTDVFTRSMARVTGDAGIDDASPGLRQLREAGVLLAGDDQHLATRRRLGNEVERVYRFSVGGIETYFRNTSVARDREFAARAASRATFAAPPRPRVARGTPAPSREIETARDARDARDAEKRAWYVESPPAPQHVGVDLASMSAADLAELAYLARERESREAALEAARASALAEVMTAPALGAYRQPTPPPAPPLGVLVVDETGRVHGAGESDCPLELGGVIAFASERGVGLVWMMTDPALEALEVPGFEMRAARGGVGWYGWPLAARDRLLRVIIGPNDTSPFASIENPVELLAALEAFRAAHGVDWQGSGGAVFATMQRSSRRRGIAERSIEPAAVLEARFDAGQSVDWDRAPGSKDHGSWIHTYDRNGAYLSVLGDVAWPEGAPELVVTNFEEAVTGNKPGWWKVAVPEWPAELPRVATPIEGDTIWTTTPGLVFMQRDLELELSIDAAWIWPNSHQSFRTLQRKLRDARAALVAGGGPAYDAHKLVYSQGVNWWRAAFHEAVATSAGLAEGPPGWHPNAQAQVATLARINAYRSMRKMVTAPIASLVVDEYAWITDEPDPLVFASTNSIELGTALGSWKHGRSVAAPAGLSQRYRPGRVRQAILEAFE